MRGCSTSEGKRCEIGRMLQKRKFDVFALSETKLKGRGEVPFGSVVGRKSGVRTGRAREGVALLVSDRVKEKVSEWKEVSARMMWVKVKWGCETWVFLSVYGPGAEKGEEERTAFWDDLSACIAGFSGNCYVVVLGDLNARVGDEMVGNVLGRFGVPGVNMSGLRMLEMCLEYDLAVGNSLFKKNVIKKYTWVRMVGGQVVERASMNYVLINGGMRGRLLDVDVLRGEAGGLSDHYLVEAKLKVKGRWQRYSRKVEVREEVKTMS